MGVKIWRRSVGELITGFASVSTFSFPGMPMWSGVHTKIIAMEADEHVSREIFMRVTRGCDGCY